MEKRFAADLRPHRAHCHARFGGLRSGISLASFAISSKTRWNSSSPEEGIKMLSYLPPISSVMHKNRPCGFSLSANVNVFRSIWSCSDFNISSEIGEEFLGRLVRCPKDSCFERVRAGDQEVQPEQFKQAACAAESRF